MRRRYILLLLFIPQIIFGEFKPEWLKGNVELVTTSQLRSKEKIITSKYQVMPGIGLLLKRSGLLDLIVSSLSSKKNFFLSKMIEKIFSFTGSPLLHIDQRISSDLTIKIIGKLVGLGESKYFLNSPQIMSLYERNFQNSLSFTKEEIILTESEIDSLANEFFKKGIFETIQKEENEIIQAETFYSEKENYENKIKLLSKELDRVKKNKEKYQSELEDNKSHLTHLSRSEPIYKKKDLKGLKRQLDRRKKLLLELTLAVAFAYINSYKNSEYFSSLPTIFLSAAFCYQAKEKKDLLDYLEAIHGEWEKLPFYKRNFSNKNFSQSFSLDKLSLKNDPDKYLYSVIQLIPDGKFFPRPVPQRMGGFTDCVETSLRNLFNILLYNYETQKFEISSDVDNLLCSEVKQFYKTYPDSIPHSVEAGRDWVKIFFNKPDFLYRSHNAQDGDFEIASEIANLEKVFAYVFNKKKPVLLEQFPSIIEQFSRKDKKISCNVFNPEGNFFEIIVDLPKKGKKESFIYTIVSHHSEIKFHSLQQIFVEIYSKKTWEDVVIALIKNILLNLVYGDALYNKKEIKELSKVILEKDTSFAADLYSVALRSGRLDNLRVTPRLKKTKKYCLDALLGENKEKSIELCQHFFKKDQEFLVETLGEMARNGVYSNFIEIFKLNTSEAVFESMFSLLASASRIKELINLINQAEFKLPNFSLEKYSQQIAFIFMMNDLDEAQMKHFVTRASLETLKSYEEDFTEHNQMMFKKIIKNQTN